MLQTLEQFRSTTAQSFQHCTCRVQSRHLANNLRARKSSFTRAKSYLQHKFLQSSDPSSVPMGKRRAAKRKEYPARDQQQAKPSLAPAEEAPHSVRLSCSRETATVAIAVGSNLRVYDQRYWCDQVLHKPLLHKKFRFADQEAFMTLPAALSRLATFRQ